MGKLIDYKYIYVKSLKINKEQKNTLHKLKYIYKIDISHFIRLAIKEKINRDYPQLLQKINKNNCPF